MNSATFAALVSVAADYLFIALRATEDFDSFLRTVRDGMREAAAAAAAERAGRFDREVASKAPESWEPRGRPSRTVVTMFGRVTCARSLYRDGRGRSRHPADEMLGIPKRKRLTADVFLWLVARAARVSSRRAARDFLEAGGCKVSAMCAWRAVRREGPLIAADLGSAPSRGISQADVFAERDGIFIALQAPERRKEAIGRLLAGQARVKSSVGLKAGCVRAGKREVGERGVRGNVALFATVGTAEEMCAGMRATVAADYDVADIERIRYASDGGGWCVSGGLDDIGGAIDQGLDLHHVMKRVCRALPGVPAARRRERMRGCRDHVASHAGLLRGGGSLGATEATDAHVWAKRMKPFGCAWSRRGASDMALALCRVCAGRPLVAPPKGALFTAAERAREAASAARRGAEAAARLAVGMGREPPQRPKPLTKNVAVPLYRRSWEPSRRRAPARHPRRRAAWRPLRRQPCTRA